MMIRRHKRTTPAIKMQGIALIIVMWMLALFTIIAVAYSSMTRTETHLTGNMLRAAKAKAYAEAGIWLGVDQLLNSDPENPARVDGYPTLKRSDTTHKLYIAIQDETGKIDVNKASQKLLAGLLNTLAIPYDESAAIVDAILDWRDKDNLRRVNGAEDNDYAADGLDYGAKDGPFNRIEELKRVKGITTEYYEKLLPAVTIHSMQARVRVSAAPEQVLSALPDLLPEQIEEILAAREFSDLTNTTNLIPDSLKPMVFVSGKGKNFTLTSEAHVDGMVARLQVTVLMKKNKQKPVTILQWQEGGQPLADRLSQ